MAHRNVNIVHCVLSDAAAARSSPWEARRRPGHQAGSLNLERDPPPLRQAKLRSRGAKVFLK